MSTIVLTNCNPEPLSSYLKALGVFRILVEQGQDPGAKMSWNQDQLVLDSKLDRDALTRLLCTSYAPTPIVSPWNGGSGFYPNDNKAALQAIAATADTRFTEFRRVVEEVRRWPELPGEYDTPDAVETRLGEEVRTSRPGKKQDDLNEQLEAIAKARPAMLPEGGQRIGLSELERIARQAGPAERLSLKNWLKALKKGRNKCVSLERGGGKEQILAAARARLPDICVDWLDAVCALRVDDSPAYNPLLGSGGNDGRLDLSNNFMQRVVELLLGGDDKRTEVLARAALFGVPMPGLVAASIGQYDPGRAGGYNQGAELETKNFKINPWDFVLTLEGTLMLAGTVTRRAQTGGRAQLSSPFTVRPSLVGFSSSTEVEGARAETWFPLWTRPMGYAELRHLFGEGRGSVGQGGRSRSRRPARSGLDFSRAVSSLGVDRGIDAFIRYAYLERRGKSYIALPAGRIPVQYRPVVRLLDELDPICGELDWFLRQFKNVPATFARARRQIDQAMFDCANRGDASSFRRMVRALGRMEAGLAERDRNKKPALSRPLGGLSPSWVQACEDGGPAVSLAAALASIRAAGAIGPIRSYMAGVDGQAPWKWAAGQGSRVWVGRNLTARLGAVLARRMLDAQRAGNAPWADAERMPVQGTLKVPARLVMPFLWAAVDDLAIEELLWGFTLIDWRRGETRAIWQSWPTRGPGLPVSRTWALLKLFFQSFPTAERKRFREPRIVPLLQARRIDEACDVARRRLGIADQRPHLVDYEAGDLDAERLLASLLIPVSDPWHLKKLILKTPEEATDPEGGSAKESA